MNINPHAKRILCFGDSNTWGYTPGTGHARYDSSTRWTGVLQQFLGNEYEVIEEGLNSRGIMHGDSRPGKEGRNAMDYIYPCLDTHDPLDYVIIFLGTNELKSEFNCSADDVGDCLKILIDRISSRDSQFREVKPQILVIVPPIVNDQTPFCLKNDKFIGARAKSVELKDVYKRVVKEKDVVLLDVQDELETGEDGVHLLESSHKLLGEKIAKLIK